MSALTSKVGQILDGSSSNIDVHSWLLSLKMLTYIACNLTEAFESNFNKPSDIISTGKVKKN